MQKRILDNGYIITRTKSPMGNGYSYYVDGGPEGKVQVIDTYLIPRSIISACLAWDLDSPKQELNNPRAEFNSNGFRF